MQKDIYDIYGDSLSGKRLDVWRRFADLSTPAIVDRIEYLQRRCVKKKVLHIGCLDHPEIIRERVESETWLHGILSNSSEFCLGVDINLAGYQLVQEEVGISNIQILDLCKPLEEKDANDLRRIQWDLILCPEMLEHITNHQQFLDNLRRLSHRGTTLIITGPNAFQISNFINALRGFETTNSDHKYWFTFYTLSRMLAANGWRPKELIYYNGPKGRSWMDVLSRLATRISRVFCDGLIIEATCLD
jgi:hypothetical protein